MTIETLRGRYRLHRFPPRQRAVTGEPLTASISAAHRRANFDIRFKFLVLLRSVFYSV